MRRDFRGVNNHLREALLSAKAKLMQSFVRKASFAILSCVVTILSSSLAGTFQPDTGSTFCLHCGALAFGPAIGATSCYACPDHALVLNFLRHSVGDMATRIENCQCEPGFVGKVPSPRPLLSTVYFCHLVPLTGRFDLPHVPTGWRLLPVCRD